MKKSLLSFACLIIASVMPLAGEINLLSPSKGQWANRQMLVIDNSNGGDFFYSIDGADPETFGFAYDGPVLLDVEGDVKLNVTYVTLDGKKEKTSVDFSVAPDEARGTNYREFVQTFFESGILNYSAGSVIAVPSNLFYALGQPADVFIPGQNLKLSEHCVLSSYIPCTIWDKQRSLYYRFIIKTYPQNAGIYSQRDIPFEVIDWDTIDFADKNYIYKIDSEYWGLPDKPVKLDRKVSHMISWQPLEYDPANPVEFFVLPPKPEVVRKDNDDGSIEFFINGDSTYTLGIKNQNETETPQLFSEVGIDAFYGDSISGNLELGVYASSVYQGSVKASYQIDKKPPVLPVVESSVSSFVSRDSVKVKISVPKGAELYVALSEPLTITDSKTSYSQNNPDFEKHPLGAYKIIKGDSFTLNWSQNGLNPVYYKVSAYSRRGDNQSLPLEYSVVIDKSNYYFDSAAEEEGADGTAVHPYTKFSQFADELVKNRIVKLRVKGELEIDKQYSVEANFEIENAGDAKINFGPNGSLVVKASTLEISGCRIHNSSDVNVKSIVPLFKLENSVLTMKDCVIGTDFAKSGTVIDSFNSIINISDTMASTNAASYTSFISSVKSRITIKNSSVNTNADTSVIISADGGQVSASKNDLMVTGANGRIAELFGVKATFTENTFKARLSNTGSKTLPLYTNKETTLKDEKNVYKGF